jgi:hypothetical protein
MESTMHAEPAATEVLVQTPAKPRLWPAVLAWVLYAPLVAFSVANHWLAPGKAWLLLLAGWLVPLAWLLALHHGRYGRAFTRVHGLGVFMGYAAGTAIAAGVGMAILFALFGQLPPLGLGS